MNPTQEQLEADLRAMIADMPTVATFGTQSVTGCKGVRVITEDQNAAGELTGYRFSFWSVLSDWEPVPVEGDLLTIGGTEFRVLRLADDPAGLRLDMGAKFAGSGYSQRR